MAIESVNPTTGERIRRYEEWSPARVDKALVDAEDAFPPWRDAGLETRLGLLRACASLLRRDADTHASLITTEMGKPVRQARAEVEKCAWVLEHYADKAPDFLAPDPAQTDAASSYAAFRPLGPLLAVMPWNFPYWQVFRFAAPALAAGNAVLLKHASNVPACATAIEQVFRDAGLPEAVFQTLLIGAPAVERLLETDAVRAVTLTGSEAAGRKVARKAGDRLKKSVMELGGSDPFVVLEDADVEEAAKTGALSRCQNSGQSCIAAKRFVVVEAVFERFLERFRAAMEALVTGDPAEEATDVGPQARGEFLDVLEKQVAGSVGKGAGIVLGGTPLEGPGFFYPPTILTGVARGMPVADEEVFGPVAPVFRVADEAEALRVANDSRFGLGASVWTADAARGERFAARVEAGAVFVNGMVKSDPRLPFGGVKRSGFGRELGRYGMLEFVNVQTVWVR